MTKEDLHILMGKNIRAERLRRDMYIEELASLLELTPSFLRSIERGRRGVNAYNLYKLVQAFDINIDTLFESDKKIVAFIEEEDITTVLRRKINDIVVGLSKKEMLIIINQIKGIRELNHIYIAGNFD